MGAVFNQEWLQERWPKHIAEKSINYKELFALWAACCTWGHHWSKRRVLFITDNKPITELWQSGSSSSPDLMNLLRSMYSKAVECQFSISLKHILGHFNMAADALSRFKMDKFFEAAPDSQLHPTPPIPVVVWSPIID